MNTSGYAIFLLEAFIGLILAAGAFFLLRELFMRRAAARTSHAEKEWFSATLRSIGDAVIVTDRNGVIAMMNPVAEQFTAWPAAEAIGRPLLEVFNIVEETTRKQAEDPVRRAIAEGARTGLANQAVLLARDGREYVIEHSVAPTCDVRGSLQGVVLVFRDVTARRLVERSRALTGAELEQQADTAQLKEQILNAILDSVQIGICMTGPAPDFPIVAISRQMREWIGNPPDSTPAHSAYQKALPDGTEPLPELLPIYRATVVGEVVSNEPWIIRREGQEPFLALVNVAPVRDSNGLIIGAVHSWVDMTERQRLDRALRISQSRLQVLSQSSVIGLILELHRDGQVRDANAAFLHMLGYDAKDMASGDINLFAITPSEYHDRVAVAFAELDETGVCGAFETEFLRKDGSHVSAFVGFALMADVTHEYAGFALDLTHQKELENQLRLRSEQLLFADRRKDEFLAMLAHELRNPLAPLRNAVHLLETDANTAAQPAMRQLLPMMRRQLGHLVRLVDDLLDAARIGEGKLVMERKSVMLQDSISAAIETVDPLIRQRGHSLNIESAPEPLYVTGDGVRLAQMFGNILHNAVKYTSPGGHISVSVRREKDEAVIRIKDDGQGISEDLLPYIFDTFVQADQSLARSAGGIGIGLSVVRRVAQLHAGRVEAASAGPGQGSEFRVFLPLSPATTNAAADAEATPGPQAKTGKRVLVVDDNTDLASSTAALLEFWGHVPRVIYDGESVIAAAREFLPDVVLLDIGLPGLDGFEVARRLRSEPVFSETILIAITGYGQQADRENAMAAGFVEHLVKPVQPGELKALLERC